jgi:hypothetical protein
MVRTPLGLRGNDPIALGRRNYFPFLTPPPPLFEKIVLDRFCLDYLIHLSLLHCQVKSSMAWIRLPRCPSER